MAKSKLRPKPLQWRLECLAHSAVECLAALLPGPAVFRMGEWLGALAWHLFPQRRNIVIRNLRIAFAGEKDLPEIERMARDCFRRTGGNLVSSAHTARLTPQQLAKVIRVEGMDLLEQALAGGGGVVLLLAHMGNWEVLSRLIHLFPKGSKTGALYRPLNNPYLDRRVLDRRQKDGTRMFSKRDPFHQITGFLREGGIVGVLADQRVGKNGELVPFFGRYTRASPLPSLLARRSKSTVLGLSLITERPGSWKAVFSTVATPYSTPGCMNTIETMMKSSVTDVFWMQERWKLGVRKKRPIDAWVNNAPTRGDKPYRALVWLDGAPDSWSVPPAWMLPDLTYEAVLAHGQSLPPWLPESTVIHRPGTPGNAADWRKTIDSIDRFSILPLDFILASDTIRTLSQSSRCLTLPVVFLP